jgi:uncharacterized damage-inducible protein DinB
MTMLNIIKEQYKIRVFQESTYRIKKVLKLLTPEQIWYAPNGNTNSIGNLVLHLCGNVRQWIGTGIGDLPDVRTRDREFSTTREATQILLEKLEEIEKMTLPIINALDEKSLETKKIVQGYEETHLSIIIHVIEHFSYHTGQIALLGKIALDQQLGFYDNIDLNVIGDKRRST